MICIYYIKDPSIDRIRTDGLPAWGHFKIFPQTSGNWKLHEDRGGGVDELFMLYNHENISYRYSTGGYERVQCGQRTDLYRLYSTAKQEADVLKATSEAAEHNAGEGEERAKESWKKNVTCFNSHPKPHHSYRRRRQRHALVRGGRVEMCLR